MAAAIGTLGKLGIDSVSPVTKMFDFRSEALARKDDSVNGNGVRGTRSHHINRVRAGLQKISGNIALQPNAYDLSLLLPWILCGTTVGNWHKLGEAAATRYVSIDRHAKVFNYATVGVGKATFKADQGALLDCDLDLVACTETVANAGTFPALQPDRTSNPFILSDLALSVNSTVIPAKSFELSIDNDIDDDRFFNSNTMTAIVARDREITFKTRIPYGEATALYNLGAGTGIAVSAILTNGVQVLSFQMANVVFPPMSPLVPGREEVMLDLEGRAYRSGDTTDDTTQELVTTLALS